MKPSIYPIEANYPGRLFIMPKPSGEWLQEDIHHYKSMGVDLVISMLEHEEIEELSLQNERRLCAEMLIQFLNLPIPDRGLPNKVDFIEFTKSIRPYLLQNKGVAVHCRAGIGRSGMLVCTLLASFVGSVSTTIDIVSHARGVSVPDTDAQLKFIETVVQELYG
ncbi:protein-tyrosine phosphatase family protein [Roseovarius phycicola]|uniref:Dual specificity protein phosphatase family protein n=1 Tax=Roseovarius phycicola TaxID=3080976 RepID=A0ABZ2HJU4_9RHOB